MYGKFFFKNCYLVFVCVCILLFFYFMDDEEFICLFVCIKMYCDYFCNLFLVKLFEDNEILIIKICCC